MIFVVPFIVIPFRVYSLFGRPYQTQRHRQTIIHCARFIFFQNAPSLMSMNWHSQNFAWCIFS